MRSALSQPVQSALNDLQPPRWLTIPFAIVAITDILVTYYALYIIGGGLFYEKNELAVAAMQHFGVPGLLIPYTVGIIVWTSLSLIHPWRRLAFRLLGVFYISYATVVVLSNLTLVHPYLPLLG